MLYYAASTKGFYDTDINAVIPADAVRITRAEHAALLAAQATGKEITSDAKGKPVAVEREVTVMDQSAIIRLEAVAAFKESDSALLDFYEQGVPVPDEWKKYRDVLRDIIAGNGTLKVPDKPKKSGA